VKRRHTRVPGGRKLAMLDYDEAIIDSLEVYCKVVPAVLTEHAGSRSWRLADGSSPPTTATGSSRSSARMCP
jgi:hypothetical protein